MKKNELKTRLIIAQGELEAELYNENGCFDEIANNIFMLAFSCEDLLDKSSNDTLIQLDKSVKWKIAYGYAHYVDGIFLSLNTMPYFTCSEYGGAIYSCLLSEVDREIIIEVVKELIKMCGK